MCELLALSGSRPLHLNFSLRALAAHGGTASPSHDGWGAAFYQGQDVALFREPAAAADSPLVTYLESRGPATELAISHIRRATRGAVQLSNTQPFVRELGGRAHVFAHNGDLPGIEGSPALALTGTHRPIGQTDSEHAFCALLSRLNPLWQGQGLPPLNVRVDVVAALAADLRRLGPANFLYADGDVLFAHGHRRLQPVSRLAEPPGLWWLQRECADAGGSAEEAAGVSVRGAAQSALLLASVPLSDEAWRPLSEGELLVVRAGRPVATSLP